MFISTAVGICICQPPAPVANSLSTNLSRKTTLRSAVLKFFKLTKISGTVEGVDEVPEPTGEDNLKDIPEKKLLLIKSVSRSLCRHWNVVSSLSVHRCVVCSSVGRPGATFVSWPIRRNSQRARGFDHNLFLCLYRITRSSALLGDFAKNTFAW